MFSDLLFSLDEMLFPRRVIACWRLFILFLSSTSEIIMEIQSHLFLHWSSTWQPCNEELCKFLLLYCTDSLEGWYLIQQSRKAQKKCNFGTNLYSPDPAASWFWRWLGVQEDGEMSGVIPDVPQQDVGVGRMKFSPGILLGFLVWRGRTGQLQWQVLDFWAGLGFILI